MRNLSKTKVKTIFTEGILIMKEKQNRNHESDCENENIMKYIENSSIFDVSPYYQKEKIAEILKNAGAKEVHFENSFGWDNQPEVVVFKGITCKKAKSVIEDNGDTIHPLIKNFGINVRNKDWKNRKQ